MKKLILSFLFLISVIISAQSPMISLPERSMGVGTNIIVPVNIYSANPLRKFILTIEEDTCMYPKAFYYTYATYNWIMALDYSNGIRVAGVGSQTYFPYGEQIGIVKFFVKKTFRENGHWYPNTRFFDGETYWSIGMGATKILDIPFEKYGDLNGDSNLNLDDAVKSFDMLGTTSANDTLNVIADLNGDGMIDTYDTYLLLLKILNPNYCWPIFYNGDALGNITISPITFTWKKIQGGMYGLFSNTKITNADLVAENQSIQLSGSGWLKKNGNKIYLLNQNQLADSPILISSKPIKISGTINEGRKISVDNSVVGIEDNKSSLPTQFELLQNYPNPFNPSTIIRFNLPEAGFVSLKVYNMLGQEVANLLEEFRNAGKNEISFTPKNLSSGTYIYRIKSGNMTQQKKMVLLK